MSDGYKVYASKDYVESVVESKANTSDLTSHINDTSNPHSVTLSQLGVTATSDELNYIDGVTSNVQTQLNSLSGLIGDTSVATQISEAMAAMTDEEIDAICGATIYNAEEVEL